MLFMWYNTIIYEHIEGNSCSNKTFICENGVNDCRLDCLSSNACINVQLISTAINSSIHCREENSCNNLNFTISDNNNEYNQQIEDKNHKNHKNHMNDMNQKQNKSQTQNTIWCDKKNSCLDSKINCMDRSQCVLNCKTDQSCQVESISVYTYYSRFLGGTCLFITTKQQQQQQTKIKDHAQFSKLFFVFFLFVIGCCCQAVVVTIVSVLVWLMCFFFVLFVLRLNIEWYCRILSIMMWNVLDIAILMRMRI